MYILERSDLNPRGLRLSSALMAVISYGIMRHAYITYAAISSRQATTAAQVNKTEYHAKRRS
jgi:hypothetical protein